MGTTVTFQRPDGKNVQGYLSEAPQARANIVVLQEWWGLNEQIRATADRFAAAGYTALVPDLYRGQSTLEAEEAHHLMSKLDFADAAGQDIRGAVQFLKGRGGKVGLTGFCMGGALTLLASTMTPELDAAAVWYGYPPLEFVDASKIQAPVLAHWAEQDQFFAIAGVDALEEKLRAAGVDYTGHRYLAHHAFANDQAVGPRRLPQTQYDPVWASMAWDRTFAFFGRTLG